MHDLKVYRLEVVLRARTPVRLEPPVGSKLRGAFFGALRRQYCAHPERSTCADCPLAGACPVETLVSTFRPGNPRGRDVPRPYTLEPPLREGTYAPDEEIRFGFTLVGEALQLFPYVALSLKGMEAGGLGAPGPDRRRGRFLLEAMDVVHPFRGERQPVYRAEAREIARPDLPVTAEDLLNAPRPSGERVAITFLTPTRIVEAGRLVRRPLLGPLVRRLLERADQLARYFGAFREYDREEIQALADQVRLAEDETRWRDLWSGSRRKGRRTPMGGFVGRAVYRSRDWERLLPWLRLGELIHVGKDAVKGNGWYRIDFVP